MSRLGQVLLKEELPAFAAQALKPDLARSLSGLGMAPRRRLELLGKACARPCGGPHNELNYVKTYNHQISQRVLNHISEAGDL